MLSKSKIKLINSLQQKKNRDKLNLFVAEGEKIVKHISQKFNCKYLICDNDFYINSGIKTEEYIEIKNNKELKKISQLTTPNRVVGVFQKPIERAIKIEELRNNLTIALDTIQDYGNLGTIIRIADWFGIEHIVCSNNTVDVYNNKVIQATMGAICNVNILYLNLEKFIKESRQNNIKIYGALLDGNNIYKSNLESKGILLMGNEGKGISAELEKYINNKLTIPSFSTKRAKSESLNVAIATAIICSEFKKKESC